MRGWLKVFLDNCGCNGGVLSMGPDSVVHDGPVWLVLPGVGKDWGKVGVLWLRESPPLLPKLESVV